MMVAKESAENSPPPAVEYGAVLAATREIAAAHAQLVCLIAELHDRDQSQFDHAITAVLLTRARTLAARMLESIGRLGPYLERDLVDRAIQLANEVAELEKEQGNRA